MPELTRLTVITSEAEAELVAGLLAAHVPHGWEEKPLPSGDTCFFVHSGHAGYCAELARTIQIFFPEARVTSTLVPEENWAESWKEFFTPVKGGEHFLVLAPWMQAEKAATTRLPLLIEPKTAFGTGHHDSTSLCLDVISCLYTDKEIAPLQRFLDLGTGSGILGIGCALLGLVGDGLDNDYVAIENAIENRALNAVPEHAFHLNEGSIEVAQGPYDLIVANILAAPLKELAPALAAALGHPGIIVLSGILQTQAADVAAAYTALGFTPPQQWHKGEWAALVFRQR